MTVSRTLLLVALPGLLLACNEGKLEGSGDDSGIGDDGGSGTDGGEDKDSGSTGDDGGDTGASGDDGGTDSGGGDDGGDDCDASVLSASPRDGSSDVALGTTIEFSLSGADSTASISLASLDGSSVAGTSWLEDDDSTAVFQPSAALAANSEYVATLDWCGGSEVSTFTTIDPGTPVSGLVGKGFLVDLGSATWVEPEGVGSLLSGLGDFELLLGVADESDTEILMFGATGDGAGGQDTCAETIDFPAADFSGNPYFQLGPTDINFDAGGYAVALANFKLSGTFEDTGDKIEEGTVEAELDIRDVADAVGDVLGTTDPTEICGYLTFFGVSCGTCSSDGASYCLDVRIEDVEAAEISGGLDEIDQENCHATCAESASNPDCDL